MAQSISVEDAFPTFQKRCTELFEENMVLRAQTDVLERQKTELEQEKTAAVERADSLEQELAQLREQLRAQPPAGHAPQPLSCVDTDALA